MSDDISDIAKQNIQNIINENENLHKDKDELNSEIIKLKNSDFESVSRRKKELELKLNNKNNELERKRKDLESKLDKKSIELESLKEEIGEDKGKYDLGFYIEVLTQNFTTVLFILMFSLAYSFLSNYQLMQGVLNTLIYFENSLSIKSEDKMPTLEQRIESFEGELSKPNNKESLKKHGDRFNILHSFFVTKNWLTTGEEREAIDLIRMEEELKELLELQACQNKFKIPESEKSKLRNSESGKNEISVSEDGLAQCTVDQSFLGEWRTVLQIIASILTIGTIVALFLPKEKLENARIGLKSLDRFEFEKFLVKFEEVHDQIKDTEELESRYSRSLALRSITNLVKTETEMLEREERAKVVWVASNNLENDIKDAVLGKVLSKLKNSKEIEYVWIIPNTNKVEQNKEGIIKKIKEFEEENGEICGKCKIIQVGEDATWMLTHDIVVYDYPSNTSVWESTFENRYLELSNEDNSVRVALNSIIKHGEKIFERNYEDQKTTS